jgi:hypothetical protein
VNAMNTLNALDGVADVLGSVRSKGVRLWSENGELHFRAPKGALAQEEIARLRLFRSEILTLLEQGAHVPAASLEREPRDPSRCIPLTPSQLERWHFYRLNERPGVRLVASAMRVEGRLEVELLRQSVAAVVRRHEALRTRIVIIDGAPAQKITQAETFEFRVDDVAALAEPLQDSAAARLIQHFIAQPVQIATDPVLGVQAIRVSDDEHILVLAMEHIVSDGISLRILWRDLLNIYEDAQHSRNTLLPGIAVQFADYALWQHAEHESLTRRHAAYWEQRLSGCGRLRFRPDIKALPAPHPGWGRLPIRIDREVTGNLRKWCRLQQTTMSMTVFAAFAAVTLHWCKVSEGVFQYQTDGRRDPRLQNTIGLFATYLYLRISRQDNDSFARLIRRVTHEYCQAYEHADLPSSGSTDPRLAFACNSAFNWMPVTPEVDSSSQHTVLRTMRVSPFRFEHPIPQDVEIDHEPLIQLFEQQEEVVGHLYFAPNQLPAATMERFRANLLTSIRTLIAEPERPLNQLLAHL